MADAETLARAREIGDAMDRELSDPCDHGMPEKFDCGVCTMKIHEEHIAPLLDEQERLAAKVAHYDAEEIYQRQRAEAAEAKVADLEAQLHAVRRHSDERAESKSASEWGAVTSVPVSEEAMKRTAAEEAIDPPKFPELAESSPETRDAASVLRSFERGDPEEQAETLKALEEAGVAERDATEPFPILDSDGRPTEACKRLLRAIFADDAGEGEPRG